MKVYPFGYAMSNAAALDTMMNADPTLLLIDTRYSPRSRMPNWNRDALKAKYGNRYHFAGRFLGNVSYANGGSIKLADPATGIRGLRYYLSEGHNLVLLCGCKEYEKCHRKVIVDLLRSEEPGVEVVAQENMASEDTVKALSICQPYASWFFASQRFIDAGIPSKVIENRDWPTNYRGPLLIHASTKFDNGAVPFWKQRFPMLLEAVSGNAKEYPYGALLGMVNLVDCVEDSDDPWFRGDYGFVFSNCTAFENPVSYRGQLNLFNVARHFIVKNGD